MRQPHLGFPEYLVKNADDIRPTVTGAYSEVSGGGAAGNREESRKSSAYYRLARLPGMR